jgi:putative phosphoesterase
MKIGIIGDTHGNLQGWQQAWELLGDSDIIFHCGDLLYHGPRFEPAPAYDPKALAEAFNACPVPIIFVQGNGDSEVDALFVKAPIQSPYSFAQIQGVRLLATHGHREPLEKTIELAAAWKVDYLLTAHLHVPQVEIHGPLTHINPGTVTYPLAQDERLARKTCAAIVDGEIRFWDVETGERLAL